MELRQSDQRNPGEAPPGSRRRTGRPTLASPSPYIWADITWLLYKAGVSWGYFVGAGHVRRAAVRGLRGDRDARRAEPAAGVPHGRGDRPARQHPPERPTSSTRRATGTLPTVSWVMPSDGRAASTRPTTSRDGQAWVTEMVNAVMQGPEEQWMHTAIFVTWDDWGGFYDHVRAARGRRERLRVPRARVR